jgi:basic membrane lipoprotein Med (substrate-binding protein (PBP1-ABC) superfamily)
MKNGGSSLAAINTAVKGGIPQDLVDKVKAKEEEILSGSFVTPVDEKTPRGSIEIKS